MKTFPRMAALVVLVVLALALATTTTAWSECVVNITATKVTHRVDRHYLGYIANTESESTAYGSKSLRASYKR